jgi:hypothetical protein
MRAALSLLLATALTVPTPVFAGNKGKKAHNAAPEQIHMSQATVALITVTERTIIFDYVSQHRGALAATPGNAKQPLPPGIAKRKLHVAVRCLQASPNGIFRTTW